MNYTDAISLTSQYFFCAYPLRLDSYNRCSIQCPYCYMRNRGGNYGNNQYQSVDVNMIERHFRRAFQGKLDSVVNEYIAQIIPIHFGGISDPFSDFELKERKTRDLLDLFNEYQYPVIISTKGYELIGNYTNQLDKGKYVIQLSIPQEFNCNKIKSDKYVKFISTVSRLISNKIDVCIRMQPLILGKNGVYQEFLQKLIDIGISHISFEHLKLPVEKNYSLLNSFFNTDILRKYLDLGSYKSGREWLLPAEIKLENIKNLINEIALKKVSIGYSDNDLMHLNKGNCCIGNNIADSFYKKYYRYTITEAIKRNQNGIITLSSIKNEWYPQRSINRVMNSHSKIKGIGVNIKDYITRSWNNKNTLSPLSYYGVTTNNEKDSDGNIVYLINPRKLTNAST